MRFMKYLRAGWTFSICPRYVMATAHDIDMQMRLRMRAACRLFEDVRKNFHLTEADLTLHYSTVELLE